MPRGRSGNSDQRKRTARRQRALIAFNIALVLVCVMSAAGMTYVKRQIAVKNAYGLSVTRAEQDALAEQLSICSG